MSVPNPIIAKKAPAPTIPATEKNARGTAYEAGGPVVDLHREISMRLAGGDSTLGFAQANPDIVERCVAGLSRAMGPILLGLGYFAVWRLVFG